MAIKQNIVIDQGSSVQLEFNLVDSTGTVIDLTDYNARAQMRKHYESINSVSFACTINVASGGISLYLDSIDTDLLSSGRYVYDVELYSDSTDDVYRIVEGLVTVNPGVTK